VKCLSAHPLFNMNLDIYYAKKKQDRYGEKLKDWYLDQTLRGFVETVGSEDKSKTFFEYKGQLVGRTIQDPRVSIEGFSYPITDVLVTNIRDIKTCTEFYIETYGERKGESTLYEISAIEPHVDPFNRIEYWRLFLNRIDAQVLINSD
jgi:hypothetical protein